MPHVLVVAGARPNFMKIAPMLRAFAARPSPLEPLVVHTGQHHDFNMSGVFFEQLGIREPDIRLTVGAGGHGVRTGQLMASFELQLLAGPRPRGVVVVGDVDSTMACALTAAKLGLPVAHVEAGLRSFDRSMPEEINRVVTDAVADLLLVSEPAGLANLAAEGVAASRIHYVGNVMIDSLVYQLPAIVALDMPARLGLTSGAYALVTLHRPSNVDSAESLRPLVAFLLRLARVMPTVFPVHPRTEEKLRVSGLRTTLEADPGMRLSPPLGYQEFVGLMAGASVVISDSGGVQEETTYLGVPCLTLRPNTERPVTLTHGTNTLVGTDLEAAWRQVEALLAGHRPRAGVIEGWDGHAADRIVDKLIDAWA